MLKFSNCCKITMLKSVFGVDNGGDRCGGEVLVVVVVMVVLGMVVVVVVVVVGYCW